MKKNNMKKNVSHAAVTLFGEKKQKSILRLIHVVRHTRRKIIKKDKHSTILSLESPPFYSGTTMATDDASRCAWYSLVLVDLRDDFFGALPLSSAGSSAGGWASAVAAKYDPNTKAIAVRVSVRWVKANSCRGDRSEEAARLRGHLPRERVRDGHP